MIKYNPVYRITIYRANKEDATEITLPITTSMTIARSILSNNTSANISIYNLSASTRKKIYQPPFQAFAEDAEFIKVEAGYGDYNSMYVIFSGRVMQAYSTKEGGGVDIETIIEAQPFDIYSSYSSYQFAAGTSYKEAINVLASDMPDCTLTNTGKIEGAFKTDTTIQGNTLDMINKISGGNTFIDNGQINSLLSNEVIDVPVPVITDSNALLSTPKRNAANLTIKILFEPSLIIGQLLEIHSGIEPDYDGQYKVLGFTHNLYFSGSTEGQRTTTVELWGGNLLENTPIYISGDQVQETFNKVKKEEVTPVVPSKSNLTLIAPVKGRISSNYGTRFHPILKRNITHSGLDIAVKTGTPVKASADGKVVFSGWNGTETSGYGKLIKIDHGNLNGSNCQTWYAHLSSLDVKDGTQVKQGQIIGKSGMTGYATGPHLHFEVRIRGQHQNPLKYIKF